MQADHSRHRLTDSLWLDARRGAWFPRASALVVADLHLGCAWAHRHGGNLVPLAPISDERERLHALIASYAPKKIILLGDIVHRAIPVPALKDELCSLVTELSAAGELILVAGNHDRRLRSLLASCGLSVPLADEFQLDEFLLTHGDTATAESALLRKSQVRSIGGRIIIGHEHPAIHLGDGVTTSVKCPCFLVGDDVIILPAFSGWAAGSPPSRFMSHYARDTDFQPIAILGEKLLPIKPR